MIFRSTTIMYKKHNKTSSLQLTNHQWTCSNCQAVVRGLAVHCLAQPDLTSVTIWKVTVPMMKFKISSPK